MHCCIQSKLKFNIHTVLPFTVCFSISFKSTSGSQIHMHTCTPLSLLRTVMLHALWTHWLSGSHGKRQDSIALTITWTFLLKILKPFSRLTGMMPKQMENCNLICTTDSIQMLDKLHFLMIVYSLTFVTLVWKMQGRRKKTVLHSRL